MLNQIFHQATINESDKAKLRIDNDLGQNLEYATICKCHEAQDNTTQQ